MLSHGKYVFVEYSTNVTKGVAKLQEDIEKCLDATKTKIPVNGIAEIMLCINFNLSTEEIQSLEHLLGEIKIRLTVYMLDSLVLELHLQHRDLVHEYLGDCLWIQGKLFLSILLLTNIIKRLRVLQHF